MKHFPQKEIAKTCFQDEIFLSERDKEYNKFQDKTFPSERYKTYNTQHFSEMNKLDDEIFLHI